MRFGPFRLAAAMAAVIGLSGCAGTGGFTPLYAAPGAAAGLSHIEVVAPSGRTGYLLREALDDSLAVNRSEPPQYRLALIVRQGRGKRGLRTDNIATRYEVVTTVAYALTRTADRQRVTSGIVRVNVTSDSADQPYAGIAAQLDADERSAAFAAQQITTRLAAYFANPSSKSADGAAPSMADLDMQSVGDRLQGEDITVRGSALDPNATEEDILRVPAGQP